MTQRSFLMLAFLSTFMVLFPDCAFATYDFLWTPSPDDRSIQFLSSLFGTVGDVLVAESNSNLVAAAPMIGQLFRLFNLAVVSLGSIIVSYAIFVSALNTAQEGQMMGQKWSSAWIPLRAMIGLTFLLPTKTGYSIVQVMMMQFVLYGVGAADQMWKVILDNYGIGPNAEGKVQMEEEAVRKAAEGLFMALMCQAAINDSDACQKPIGGGINPLDPKSIVDSLSPNLIAGQRVIAYPSTTFGDPMVFSVNFGVPFSPLFSNVCGTITAENAPRHADSMFWGTINTEAILSTAYLLAPEAKKLYMYNSMDVFGVLPNPKFFASAIINLSSAIMGALPVKNSADASQLATTAYNNGWLYAGSYYFLLVTKAPLYEYPAPHYSAGDLTFLGKNCQEAVNKAMNTASAYLSTIPKQPIPLNVGTNVAPPDGFEALYSTLLTPIRNATFKIINYLTTNDSDPLTSLRTIGGYILEASELLFFALLMAAFLIMLIACLTMEGLTPFCTAAAGVFVVLVPAFLFILILLWSAGILLALYLPLVPYLVFTFSSLAWFLLVIEAIAAAPVVALGFAAPAGETLGKAAPAVMIITNIFLRPSLMLMGFMLAINLLKAVVFMLNFGFKATIMAFASSIGLFGCISLIILYGGIMTTLVHECFSLIYVLPDKIIRWIGDKVESGSTVEQSVQQVKGASDTGAKHGSSIMQGASQFAHDKVKDRFEKAKELGKK